MRSLICVCGNQDQVWAYPIRRSKETLGTANCLSHTNHIRWLVLACILLSGSVCHGDDILAYNNTSNKLYFKYLNGWKIMGLK